jgi:hypothetical protein
VDSVFKSIKPQQRLTKVDQRELCCLCFCHLKGRECWSLGKVPNCTIHEFNAPHHSLLHAALVAGHIMIVQKLGEEQSQVHLCREDVRLEVAGRTTRLHALYDWGASVTLITHAAAKEAGQSR